MADLRVGAADGQIATSHDERSVKFNGHQQPQNSSGASHSKPSPESVVAAAPQQESYWQMASPWVHAALGAGSFVPGFGTLAAGADTLIYLGEGDKAGAAMSAVSMVPGGKIVTTVGKVVKEGVTVVKGAEVATQVAKHTQKIEGAVKATGKMEDAAKDTQQFEKVAEGKGRGGGAPPTELPPPGIGHNGGPPFTPEEIAQNKPQFLELEHTPRKPTASGNFEESSTIAKHGDTPLKNSRSTPEGRAADADVRDGVLQRTGMDPGHDVATSLGANPADRLNVSPQNSIQNRTGGTWNKAEAQLRKTIKEDPGAIKETEIRKLYRPGSDTPIARQMINKAADGSTTGEDVVYLNAKSPATRLAEERAAQGTTLAPGEARQADGDFRKFLKDQKANAEEIKKGQAEWNRLREEWLRNRR